MKNIELTVEYVLAKTGLRLMGSDEGQGLIEYVLIAALISISAIAAIKVVGPAITTQFDKVSAAMPTTP